MPARLLGSLVAFAIQRKALQKIAFNAALFALETTVAVIVWYLILQDENPLGPRGWLATVITVLVISLLGSLLVSVVIAIATGERPRVFGEVVGIGQAGDVANACFALVAVYILAVDWRAGWLLAVLGGVLLFAYRSYEGVRKRSESLEQVNRFTELVGREVELEAVVRTVLSEVRSGLRGRLGAPAADPRRGRSRTGAWTRRPSPGRLGPGRAPARRTGSGRVRVGPRRTAASHRLQQTVRGHRRQGLRPGATAQRGQGRGEPRRSRTSSVTWRPSPRRTSASSARWPTTLPWRSTTPCGRT